ncbi:MAG: ferrous iron transport protein B [Hydrogenobaculum sp.]
MKKIEVAFVGNPNVGKSTIINNIAKTSLKVGNWPGVTVRKTEASLVYKDYEFHIIDLPGTYSLDYTSEDVAVTTDFLLNSPPDIIVNIIEATNLERSLILTAELIELKIPMVIVLNMWDEALKLGIDINIKKMSELIGVDVISAIGTKEDLKDRLLESLINTYEKKIVPKPLRYSDITEKAINDILSYCAVPSNKNIPPRFFAIKMLERIIPCDCCNEIILKLENDLKENIYDILKKDVYGVAHFISSSVVKRSFKDEIELTEILDKFALHPFFGLLIFVVIMYLMFKLSFDVSYPISNWIGNFESSFLHPLVYKLFPEAPYIVKSFVSGAVLDGVGFVVSFAPLVGALFFGLSLLELSGYLPRVPIIFDRFVSKFGIDGRGILPFMLGFGCNVPAIMALKILEDRRSKLIVAAMIPFTSCPARFVVFAFLGAIFFKNPAPIILFLYLLGIFFSILTAIAMNKILPKTDNLPMILELPPYRRPPLKIVLNIAFVELKGFLKRAGTFIFASTVVVWAFLNIPPNANIKDTVAGRIGSALVYVFKPIGIEDWRATTSLVPAFLAREIIISSMGAIYSASTKEDYSNFNIDEAFKEQMMSLEQAIKNTALSFVSPGFSNVFTQESNTSSITREIRKSLSPYGALSFMVFVLLYTSCIATVSILKSEFGTKFAVLFLLYSFVLGWAVAFVIYRVSMVLHVF